MVAKCSRCGANLPPKNKFCPDCGRPVYAPPTATQGVSKLTEVSIPPSTPPSQLAPSSRLGAAFWLGLVGAIFFRDTKVVQLFVLNTLSFRLNFRPRLKKETMGSPGFEPGIPAV
jgi:hypothetical protein